jgi:hypothetical protein
MNEINGQELSPEDVKIHQVALQNGAAEAYLLGELGDDARDAYEAHFFNCADCAAIIQTGMRIIEVGLADEGEATPPNNVVVFDDARKRRELLTTSSLLWALPSVAASLLAVFLAYQTFVTIPHLVAQSHTASTHAAAVTGLYPEISLQGQMRGNGDTTVVDAERPVNVPIENDPAYVRYDGTIRNAASAVVGRSSCPAIENVEMLTWVLPQLPAGTYTMVIEGVRKEGNRRPIANARFDVSSH